VFKAARSLDIYTYSNTTSELRYDYGYVDPDIEQDVYLSLAVNQDITPLIQLFTMYSESLSQIGEIIEFENKFNMYRSSGHGLQRSIEVIDLTPLQIQQFQNNHQVYFAIELGDMPVDRFENKLVRVKIGLIGATSLEPFECKLSHFGPTK